MLQTEEYQDKIVEGIMEGIYTESRKVHAEATIFGKIICEKEKKEPFLQSEKIKTGNQEEKYRINFNNFQINFYKTLSKFKIYDTIEENKKFRIFSNLYLPISVTKITNSELEKISKEYTIEEATEKGTKQLEEQIEAEIEEKQNILREKCTSNRKWRIFRNKCNI